MSGTPGSTSHPSQHYQQLNLEHNETFDDDHLYGLQALQDQQQHGHHDIDNTYHQWNAPEPTIPAHASSYDEQEFAQPYLPGSSYYGIPTGLDGQYYQNYVAASHVSSSQPPSSYISYGQIGPAISAPPAPAYQAVPPAPIAPPASAPAAESEKQDAKPKPHLKFVRYQEANKLFCGEDRILPKIWADCGRNMNKVPTQPRLVSYRRNYVQVDAMFRLPLPQGPEAERRYRDGLRGKTLHVEDFSGRRWPVGGFGIGMSALVDGADGKDVSLVQHTPKRDKNVSRVMEVPLLPNMGKSGTYVHNLMISPDDENAQMPALPNQIRYPHQPISAHNQHTFERVQFQSATGNNGNRRAAQQFYHLVITLNADVATLNTNGSNGTHLPRWLPVRHLLSHGVIVRGRSPTHYSMSDLAGRNVENDEDDGTTNDYDKADDGSGRLLPAFAVPQPPEYLPIPPDRAWGPPPPVPDGTGAPDAQGTVGSVGSAASAGRTGVQVGSAVCSTATRASRRAATRAAGTGSASRGSGGSGSRSGGGSRQSTHAGNNILAPQHSGRISKPASRRQDSNRHEPASTAARRPQISRNEPGTNVRHESDATSTTTTTTATATQYQSLPTIPFQAVNNMVRDTQDTSSYAYHNTGVDIGYGLEHGQGPGQEYHEHHEHEHQHNVYDNDLDDDEEEHEYGPEPELSSHQSSSVKHEQSSSLSPMLSRGYHPANFNNTPPLNLSQPQPLGEHDPHKIMPAVPPFEGGYPSTSQFLEDHLIPSSLFLDPQDIYSNFLNDGYPALAPASAERSTGQ